ncbi:RND family efflux transporter MFP subunit [Sulfuritortus calidifontis]|uniref:RND family efflux transporter MFP subunit n=1 Tax=Sulfuritortus calidifontis TaxID=1914471 RepID=A0A4R3JUP3_9PROT|nr:efflux RND transporter periplasmic adaptor subunit [Sulfuritortus calidifontis]TCS71544.1 RND family efflux transporter MFP subunit [Sulfuritortus calidifontis]
MKLPARFSSRLGLILFGLGLLAAFAFVVLRTGPLAATRVVLAKVETRELKPAIFGIGSVEARHAFDLGPTVASRVLRVRVDVGDRVEAGQVVAEMDPVDLDQRLAAAESAYRRAAFAVDSAAAAASEAASRKALATANAERFEQLRQQGFVSQEAVEVKRHEAQAAGAAHMASQASLAAARQDAARLRAERAAVGEQRANSVLRSPVAGVVTARKAEPGSTVVAGQGVIRLVDPTSLWVTTRIDQARAAGLKLGMPASIVLRSRPQAPLAGRVARLEPAGDSVTEERLVQVAFDQQAQDISLGELAEVTLALPVVAQALSLPNAAIQHRGEQVGVWRVVDGEARFRPVTLGAQTLDGRVQILTGLAQGEQVVAYSEKALSEGERVQAVARLAGNGR